MKTFIIILILAALLQTTFVPINLVILLLISRSLIIHDRANLYLALIFGILIGILSSVNIGFYGLCFLIIAELVTLLRKTPLTAHFSLIVPLTFGALLLLSAAERLFLGQTINFWLIILESFVALPVYLVIKFWEERFVVAPPVKLKL